MPRKRPIQLDDLFRLRAVQRVAISPDLRQVAFELKRFDLSENRNFMQIMLVAVDGGTPRSLTSGKQVDSLPKWAPDGASLAFLSDRDKVTRLYILPMTGGEPRAVTDREGNVRDFAWSPDGRRLAFTYQPLNAREKLERDGKQDEVKKRPQFKHITRLFHKLDGSGWWNGNHTHVWIVSAEGGRARRLTGGSFDDTEPRFSPDGRLVSFISNRTENPDMHPEQAQIYTVRPSGGPIRRITQGPGWAAGHAWSPDGGTIAYIGNIARTGQSWKHLNRVWLVPSAGGRPRELTRQIDNHCWNLTLGDVATSNFEVTAPIWSADGSRIHFLVSERGACRLYSQALRGQDYRCEVGGDVNIYNAQRTAGDGPIALSIGTATNPGDVYVTATPWRQHSTAKTLGWRQLQRGRLDEPMRLTHVNGKLLDGIELAQPEELTVQSGRVRVQAWVFKPPGFNPRRKYPAILEIHGGPHAQIGHAFFHEKQWLAARGYVVVHSNPRGSIGYGLDYSKSIHADWGNLDYQDLMRVADWVFARPYVDRKRVGVTGGSYGGFMTNWIVGHTGRFRAAVSQRSVVNLESMFGTSDYGYDLGFEFGGLPWEKRDLYRRQSPLTYVQKVSTPLLIEHEEQDHRCPIEQAEQFFTALKVLGRTVELVRFEGESHGLCRGGRPQNRGERLRRILGWFEHYMR
jgi:dipeptidyl aminopeptidase/acylaminoacyl peptidase